MNGRRVLIGVFSGLVFSGKSFFRKWVMSQREYQGAVLVSMDEVRDRFWSGRSDTHITKTEHVFKNEATRFEAKTRLIVERRPTIFMEMVMLTRAAHQRPFVEMVASASMYLQTIEKEEAARDGESAPEAPVRVDFRCIYFYCDLEAVKRRIGYRLQEVERFGNISNASVFDLGGYARGAQQIEIPPDGYEPLYLNTSDETPAGLQAQRQEILAFLRGNGLDLFTQQKRAQEAQDILGLARQIKTK